MFNQRVYLSNEWVRLRWLATVRRATAEVIRKHSVRTCIKHINRIREAKLAFHSQQALQFSFQEVITAEETSEVLERPEIGISTVYMAYIQLT